MRIVVPSIPILDCLREVVKTKERNLPHTGVPVIRTLVDVGGVVVVEASAAADAVVDASDATRSNEQRACRTPFYHGHIGQSEPVRPAGPKLTAGDCEGWL